MKICFQEGVQLIGVIELGGGKVSAKFVFSIIKDFKLVNDG
jgi:hypothetical protein